MTTTEPRFHFPAEWEAHRRCWMSWPCRTNFWREKIHAARKTHAEVARAVSAFEPVRMIARPQDAAAARKALRGCAEVWEFPLNDSWLRDNGPVFAQDDSGAAAILDFGFNAWGEKHRGWREDDRLPGRIARRLGMRRIRAPMILEGGAIHTDGEGTLLTTEQCLLHPNRNPGMSRLEIEGALRRFLGAKKIIWLPGDPRDSETDGHVDEVARFAAPGLVLAMAADDRASPSRAALAENIARLRRTRDARGRKLEVRILPQPFGAGSELLGSYVNFHIANGGIIAPVYNLPETDARALEVIRRAIPDRKITPIDARTLAWGGGGIHCITQQEPLF